MKYAGIAFRNLNRQKKRSFLLGGAIAFGIMIVTLINSFSGSFVENIGENFSQLLAGHIFILGNEKTESGRIVNIIHDDKAIMDVIRQEQIPVKYLSKRSSFSGTLVFGTDSIVQSVEGVNWKEESNLKSRLVLKGGSWDDVLGDPRSIIISDTMAKKLNVQVGESILVRLKTATGQQNVGEFVLRATSHDPGLFGSISAYADIEYVNSLLNIRPQEYVTLGFFLEDIRLINIEAAKIYKALSKAGLQVFERQDQGTTNVQKAMKAIKDSQWTGTKYQIITLNDYLSQVQQIVNILNTVSIVILVILFLIIMVGITNTFRMVMYERTREIGTMRALGMQRQGVRRLFLYEAVFLSIGGTIAGLVASGIVMIIVSLINFGLDSMMSIFLKNGHMTFKFIPTQMIINIVIVAALTLIAAFFPARKAASLEPADALRKTY